MSRTNRILLCAAVLAAAGHSSLPAAAIPPQEPAAAEVRTIEVIARKFAFEPAQIEVNEGERVRLVVHSADGVHGVGIKRFGVSKLVPRGGAPVTIEFVASAAGTFPILCSEYCGEGHEDMKGALVVRARPQ